MKFNYLVYDDFILINEMTIERHGGNFNPPENTLHPEALHYLVETVEAEMFGAPLYPTLADKAALYLFNVVSNHVFSDGNKRTGLEAALLFLRINGYGIADWDAGKNLRRPMSMTTLTEFVLEVASGKHTLEAVRQWFKSRVVTLEREL